MLMFCTQHCTPWYRAYITQMFYQVKKIVLNITGLASQVPPASFRTVKIPKNRWRPGFAPDPAGGAYDAPPDALVGWWGGTPPPQTPTTLGACGASILVHRRSTRRLVFVLGQNVPLFVEHLHPYNQCSMYLTLLKSWIRHFIYIVKRWNARGIYNFVRCTVPYVDDSDWKDKSLGYF